ncbi:MAG: MarR family winged helix-turn-helix transcriptional regulator [Lachnospiraceae bacterium]|nr:MarR family winged helix-turn-helix transcriptional regulator [Lachnospiraceae bacterium]
MEAFEKNIPICFKIKNLAHLIKRNLNSSLPEESGLTGAQGFVIGYIYNQGGEAFQKDLEKNFNIRRSTITCLLQLMEKNGFIVREFSPSDARLKKIRLTEKAEDAHKKIMEKIYEIDERIAYGISDKEKEMFLDILCKMEQNLN